MRKLVIITLLLLSITPCLRGQRKEMSQARSYIKSGKDYDKAEKLMVELLSKDSLNRMNPKIYLLLYQAVLKQYEAGNEKLYLNQQYDTASLFNITKRMFAVLEALDSVDAAPDKKGRVKLEYRKKHASELDTYRPNLYYGGTFNIHKRIIRRPLLSLTPIWIAGASLSFRRSIIGKMTGRCLMRHIGPLIADSN